jgi:carboxypeptidase Taq
VGRSRAFWAGYYADLQAVFPDQLASVSIDAFFRAINRVQPSLIRVEADEVTYNLHVMLRFELERALVSKALKVEDLPDAWKEKMHDYLGIVPEDDAHGVLQDVHWSMGAFGYFPTYTLGTLMSAQIFAAARDEIGDLEQRISERDFEPLLTWLRERVHRHGRKLSAAEILTRATGEALDSARWLAYIKRKFGSIYGSLA